MQGKGNTCCKAVLLLLPAHFLSVWPGLQEVFVVTRARRVPATTCCDHRIQISLHSAPHAAGGCSAAKAAGHLEEVVASGAGWAYTGGKRETEIAEIALLLTLSVPFLSMETQLSRQHRLLLQPHTPVFKDALLGVACTEKQLLWEWLVIADGQHKGKYLCVINAR